MNSTYYTLDISNYQILSSVSLKILPGVTLITGHSNNGKSSIFKAFQQLVYNTSGTDYIKHNQDKTTISLQQYIDNNPVYKIQYFKHRQQGGKYIVTTFNPQENTQTYTKLGTSQPEFIKDLTHIDKDLNYNFWSQMDKPFLISQTPKEQFDYLQQSPHTQTLQNVLKNMTTDRKQTDHSLSASQAQLELLQQQSKQYQSQLQHLPKIKELFTTITSLKAHQETLLRLQDVYARYTKIDLTDLQNTLNRLKTLPTLDNLNKSHDTLFQTLSLYSQLLQTTKPINELKYTIQNTITQYDRTKLFLQQQFPVCPLCNQPLHNS